MTSTVERAAGHWRWSTHGGKGRRVWSGVVVVPLTRWDASDHHDKLT